MLKKLFLYGILVISTIYLFFMYDEAVIAGILALELLYVPAAAAEVFWISRRIGVSFESKRTIASKGQNIPLKIKVGNVRWIPGVKFTITITTGNQLYATAVKSFLKGFTGSKGNGRADFVFRSEYCGNIFVCLREIRVFDSFGFFYIKKKLNERVEIRILPECSIVPMEITRRTREFIAEAEEYSGEKSGDDPSETYQIRPYQEKDSMHSIHWKMTAKEGELMVKEHGRPLGCVVLIRLDLAQRKPDLAAVSRMLEDTVSISMTLAEEKCIHMVAWYEQKNKRIVKKKVGNEIQVYELMNRLLFIEPYGQNEPEEAYFEDAFKGEHFSSTIVIDMKGKITVNGATQELLTV